MSRTGIALLGTGFIAGIHAESYRRFVPDAEVVAVYSRSPERAQAFAREKGYGYAMEKAGTTRGWTFTMFEEAFNQGYPQELRHFIDCVRQDTEPVVTAEDGRAALEMIYAAYQSARVGQKVALPFHPKVSKPIDLWR